LETINIIPITFNKSMI